MKLLFHFRTPGTGAEAVHIAGVTGGFEALGFSVVYSSPTGADPRRTAGASPYRPGGTTRLIRLVPDVLFEVLELAYNIPAFFRNWRLIRGEKFQLIYERHAFFLFSTALLAQWFRIPLVVEVNELVGDARVRRQPMLAALARYTDRLVFGRATAIVVVSPHLRRRIIASGSAPERILVLPNGVSRKELEQPADGTGIRERFELNGRTVIGFVGWFVEWHRLDRLIGMVAKLDRTDMRVVLMLVGEGPLEAELREQAKRSGLTRSEVVWTGAVPHDEIPRYIAAFDIAVIPHSNEFRSPIKLFEYMAQGRAILAPATEPIATVVTHGKDALLFDPESEEAMRECLQRLVRHREERSRLGEAARETVRMNHTWEHNADVVWRTVKQGFPAAAMDRIRRQ